MRTRGYENLGMEKRNGGRKEENRRTGEEKWVFSPNCRNLEIKCFGPVQHPFGLDQLAHGQSGSLTQLYH